jgi:hypothetical protein
MLGLGLSIPQVAVRGTRAVFSPASLFASGEQGAWYDPSDFTTLFEDSAGTTPITTVERPVGLMLDKLGRGNHAFQTSSAARPALRNRYNLVTFSEQFDNAAWTKTRMRAFGAGSVANTSATTDPLGTNTADYIQQEAGQTTFGGLLFSVSLPAGTTRTASIYAKKAEKNFLVILSNTGGDRTWFNLDTGAIGTTAPSHTPSIQSIGSGWYRCSIATSTEIRPNFYVADTDGSLTVTDSGGIYIWGAQLIVTNDLPSNEYQRIAAAPTVGSAPTYDTDTTKFPPYLEAITDDWMRTNDIVPGTDKAQVFAGVRKLSDAASGILVESSVVVNDNNGSFAVAAPAAGGATSYAAFSRGTTFIGAGSGVFAPAPDTAVLCALSDIAAPNLVLRRNGTQVASSTSNQGTGNFLTYPLYLFARNGASLFFNGRLYALIVRFGPNLSTFEIERTESYISSKMPQ